MDPQVDKTPGLGMPPPSVESGGSVLPGHGTSSATPETAHSANGAPAAAGQQPLVMPQPAQTPVQAATAVPQTMSTSDDTSDDLDQEWVSKAKAIVERTKNDPFLESRELSKAKAEYLKARFNKQIKVAEDS